MLTDKDKRVLFTIIEAYVEERTPVSSGRVREFGCYDWSTATIRNRMAVLERGGFLSKTHVSSGRVPTDDGYRLYVDDLQTNEHASRFTEIARKCRTHLRAHRRDVSEIMLQTSQFLGSISRNVAVVYGAIEQESRVRDVRLVLLEGRRLLVVVNLAPEYESTTVIRLDRDFSGDVVSASEALLNGIVAGKSLCEARTELGDALRDNMTDEGIITREVSTQRMTIFSEPPAVELYFEQRDHLLDQPELSDPKVLQLILKLLHNKGYLTSILSNRPFEGIEVTIGGEHEDQDLWPFSLVTAGYALGAARGVLGIIGPTRMRYDLALSLVGSVSRELRAIGEEYF